MKLEQIKIAMRKWLKTCAENNALNSWSFTLTSDEVGMILDALETPSVVVVEDN